ncbi:hypothetical protein QO003_000902 [Arthrobacter silviterrae]|nr:hypothetical protein [Arthrobacter silviterrae]
MEFIICTAVGDDRTVVLLAMTPSYNRGGKLRVGHTLPIREPWTIGALRDHLLVSVPYPFRPELENAHVGDRHVDFLWCSPLHRP